MSILIVGAKGSMGVRYQHILKYLGRDFRCVDKEHSDSHVRDLANNSTGIIVATPTATHVEVIKRLMTTRKPILCEKPVTKNIDELRIFLEEIREAKAPFRMMFQYKFLNDPKRIGPSHYDYFRHGSDGLIWDCMQIIALARKEVRLSEGSPIWSCRLNGKTARLDHMDAAYIASVQEWFQAPAQDPSEILRAHEKTRKVELEGIHE